MRGIPSLITDIRKKVFAEVARMAYSGDYTQMEDIPYHIVPGDSPLHRESVFLERAIAGERVRLAMGLSLRPVQTRTLLTEGMDHAAIAPPSGGALLLFLQFFTAIGAVLRKCRDAELAVGASAEQDQQNRSRDQKAKHDPHERSDLERIPERKAEHCRGVKNHHHQLFSASFHRSHSFCPFRRTPSPKVP